MDKLKNIRAIQIMEQGSLYTVNVVYNEIADDGKIEKRNAKLPTFYATDAELSSAISEVMKYINEKKLGNVTVNEVIGDTTTESVVETPSDTTSNETGISSENFGENQINSTEINNNATQNDVVSSVISDENAQNIQTSDENATEAKEATNESVSTSEVESNDSQTNVDDTQTSTENNI